MSGTDDRDDGKSAAPGRTKAGRRRKAPRHTEWRGETLYGRIRIKGKLTRWSLRTGDVEIARTRVEEDIARMKAEAFYGDQRVKYEDMAASWAEKFILHEVGPLTAIRYEVSLRQLKPFLFRPAVPPDPKGELVSIFLDEITKEKVNEIVEGRRAAGVSTATIRRDLTALASVLSYAEVDDNVALARAKRLRERRDPIVLPEPSHIERVIRRAPGRMAALIETARRTGCRLDELVTAERAKLDHTHRQLTVRGKGNKVRVVDLDFDGAYEVLRSIPPRLGCKWLFWHGNGKPYRNLSSRFAALVRGIERTALDEAKSVGHAEPDFRIFRFHDLRHRHAVDWLKAGRSIYDLQQRLGHASLKTTEIYLNFLTPEEMRAAKLGSKAEAIHGA